MYVNTPSYTHTHGRMYIHLGEVAFYNRFWYLIGAHKLWAKWKNPYVCTMGSMWRRERGGKSFCCLHSHLWVSEEMLIVRQHILPPFVTPPWHAVSITMQPPSRAWNCWFFEVPLHSLTDNSGTNLPAIVFGHRSVFASLNPAGSTALVVYWIVTYIFFQYYLKQDRINTSWRPKAAPDKLMLRAQSLCHAA